ncbi:uncharacterized protein N7511_010788 [Penicillium nucicola]|uniref:uncharacterized protein n=1 Tax=Penicillium nucicola TaxID=1850975 RepID=UPI0025450CF1|nr:uncharacterized protein N7511_010788 [Penicillium nucicola]KAJ5749092.1 hypothetical protein N7511_010788 [Penicillium nucicola]
MLKSFNLLRGGGLPLLSSTASPLAQFNSKTAPIYVLHKPYTSRSYATTSQFSHQNYIWPSNPSFSPYDVLNIPRGAPYSKRQYYDLVKIYHPDRPFTKDHPLFGELTAEVRLQRYRIVVDAHEILSDPIRRAAYDQTGTGWNHAVQDSTEFNTHGSGIYANSTWEDWERWHNRHNGPQQHVVDQRTFTRLVILLVLFGGAVQASWIGQMNTGFEDKLRLVNEESARFLHGRKDNTVKQMDSNEARVQGFLIRRDPTGSGLKDHEQTVYQKELDPLRRPKEPSQPNSQAVSNFVQPAEPVQPDTAGN